MVRKKDPSPFKEGSLTNKIIKMCVLNRDTTFSFQELHEFLFPLMNYIADMSVLLQN